MKYNRRAHRESLGVDEETAQWCTILGKLLHTLGLENADVAANTEL